MVSCMGDEVVEKNEAVLSVDGIRLSLVEGNSMLIEDSGVVTASVWSESAEEM